jgi:ribonuclease BN (tRNA processing enzyme)
MADILFLGTGGGRFNLLKQLRGTGGFLIIGKDAVIQIDPGPGALFALAKCNVDPLSIDALIVTHAHLDHVHDAPLIIEGMTGFTMKKRGVVIASKWCLEGDDFGDRSITRYHQSLAGECITFSPGDKKEIHLEHRGKKSSFGITGTPVRHGDKSGFGFVMEIDGARIGYTSDGEYFDGMGAHFAGCDVLVANCIRGAKDSYPMHLDSAQCARLFEECKPKFGIITHLGMKLIQSGPEEEAKKIEKVSGVPTFAARDGFYFCTDRCGWFKAEGKKKKEKGQGTLV